MNNLESSNLIKEIGKLPHYGFGHGYTNMIKKEDVISLIMKFTAENNNPIENNNSMRLIIGD